MSNDIIMNAIPTAGEDDADGDISAHYTLMSSLAEHSYCASVMSTDAVTQEHEIGDLFGNSVELCADMDTSIIGIGDVNLDGFNYSVPSVISGGVGDSMELENMWGGLDSDTSTTAVVEVAATSVVDVQQETEGTDGKDSMNTGVKRRFWESSEATQNQNTAANSRSRRTDFITNAKKRKSHFDIYFNRLACDLHRAVSRTGCEGNLSASFEGKLYNSTDVKMTSAHEQNDGKSLLLDPPMNNSTPTLIPDGMDDHRYAATMITQNVSSSAIRDHQYVDEKVSPSVPESDTTDNEDESADSSVQRNFGRTNAKRYRSDYIRVKWERTQIFTKLIRSLFGNKILLKQRTGAEVKLSVEFEHINFNEVNYLNAAKIISARRKQLQSSRFKLQPKIQQSSTPTPLTFIIPNLSSFPYQVPFIIPTSSGSSNVPGSNFPVTVSVSPSVSLTDANIPFSSLENVNSTQVDNDNNKRLDVCDCTPALALVENDIKVQTYVLNEHATGNELFQEVENNKSCDGVSDSLIPIPAATTVGVQDMGSEQLMVFENSSMQNSPEVSVARGMRESSTNTEPICSICFSTGDVSNDYCAANRERSATKSFWIRCNDPFCYDMVHASCVGFVVTHNVHLKQLPAYYCKSHR